MIYLDYNSTTPILPNVLEVMMPFFNEHWGNPSSAFSFSDHARESIEIARSHVADLIGAQSYEIVFTSCATESNQSIFQSFLNEGKSVVTSSIEHNSINSLIRSGDSTINKVTSIGVNYAGDIQIDELECLNKDMTIGLVSTIMANNETGIISPIDDIAKIAHHNNLYFHTDAVQAAGKVPIDTDSMEIDYLTLSAHKIYGPKGIGALYIREGTPFSPLLRGTQEKNRRGGTEAVPLIVGFGEAAKQAKSNLEKRASKTLRFRDIFETDLLSTYPTLIINGKQTKRLPNTSSITFPSIDGDVLVSLLSQKDIFVSNGSACKSSAPTPSHVLLAMGRSYEDAGATIRFSFSHLNVEEDIYIVLRTLYELLPLLSSNY